MASADKLKGIKIFTKQEQEPSTLYSTQSFWGNAQRPFVNYNLTCCLVVMPKVRPAIIRRGLSSLKTTKNRTGCSDAARFSEPG